MAQQDTPIEPVTEHEARSVTYHLFILVMTGLSLLIMVTLIILPLRLATHRFLYFIDLIICIIFFLDFLGRVRRAADRRRYFLRQGGWLDLIGSIPSIPTLPLTDIIRLARLYRATVIWRLLRFQSLRDVWAAVKFDAPRARSYSQLLSRLLWSPFPRPLSCSLKAGIRRPKLFPGMMRFGGRLSR